MNSYSITNFTVVFGNPEEVYFAGQEISGKILIEAKESIKINDILFEIKGRAKANWTSGSNKNFHSNEPYFCEQFALSYVNKLESAHDADNSKAKILPGGNSQRLEIPFSYTLPKCLPSSFEGEFGFVRYTCRAILERPWDFDVVCCRVFTVIGIEDINEEPRAQISKCTKQSIKMHFIRSGQLETELTLENCAYTSGEEVDVRARFHNKSSHSIKWYRIQLRQIVAYRAKNFAGLEKQKSVDRIVSIVNRSGTSRQSEVEWKAALVLPSLPPRLSKCSIISIGYTLELLTSISKKAILSFPIVIGTIPLLTERLLKASAKLNKNLKRVVKKEETIQGPRLTITDEMGKTVGEKSDTDEESDMDSVMELENFSKSKRRVRVPSSILSELYPGLPSPYYVEAISGPVRITDEREDSQFVQKTFAPKYPYYL